MTALHIIFDCDGVLVDSEPLSNRVSSALLAAHGVMLSPEEAHRRFLGKSFPDLIAETEREFGVRFPADVEEQEDRRLLDLYATDLAPVPGIAAALEAIGGRYAVASNSPSHRVVASLRITGLTDFFGGRITTYQDVARGKPAPDVYVEAARRLGISPQGCLVVEDSVTGVTAARGAGCRIIGFTGTQPNPDAHGRMLAAAGAGPIIGHMDELPALVAELAAPA